jgi:hypothetical protein
MQKLGVIARVSIKPGLLELLEIIIEKADGIPDEELSKRYIQRFFEYLQISSLRHVKIYAKYPNTNRLAWFYQFSLAPNIPTASCSCRTQPQSTFSGNSSRNLDNSQVSLQQPSATMLVQPRVNDPIPFDALPQDLRFRIKRAGLRRGETRSWQEARQMYEKMPENIRRRGIKVVDQYKRSHDWSHKKAHVNGGSNKPGNGDWEAPKPNRARRGRNVAHAENQAIVKAKASSNFQAGTRMLLNQAAMAGGIAFGIELAFSGLENFMAVQRGEKSMEEALVSTLANSTEVAVTTAVITGGIVTLTLAFPPVGAALGAAAPFLRIVGAVGGLQRLIVILANSGKVDGIDQVTELLTAYSIDEVDLDFRDLEVDDELGALKATLGLA